ncbi:MAG: DUF362 domain-containing protein [bacterium]|nr:DUF362 domain-containing protein [bacterium]
MTQRPIDRRSFAIQCGLLSASLYAPRIAFSAGQPSMSIARFSASPGDDELPAKAGELTRKAIEALGGMDRFIAKGDVVFVKPNIGWDRTPEQAANTNPDVVAAVVEMCLKSGAKEVHVTDNSCNEARRTFARSGIQTAAEKAGARVYFMDDRKLKKKAPINGKVLKEWEIYEDILKADKLINVPIVKHHGLSQATLSMKNLMGIIGGSRNQYHQDITNTLVDLAAFVKPDLIIIDAIRVLKANGPVGGNLDDVERKDVIAAGTDQVALDAFGAEQLGFKPEDIGYVAEAAKRGLGTMDYASLKPVEVTV